MDVDVRGKIIINFNKIFLSFALMPSIQPRYCVIFRTFETYLQKQITNYINKLRSKKL